MGSVVELATTADERVEMVEGGKGEEEEGVPGRANQPAQCRGGHAALRVSVSAAGVFSLSLFLTGIIFE